MLDLYLDGEQNKEAYLATEVQLKETIAKLESERAELAARLDQGHNLGDNEIEEIITFARDIRDGLEEADGDFEARRRVIDLLDVRGVLVVEDGEKVVYASFVLAKEPERLSVSNWPKLAESNLSAVSLDI